MKLTQKIPARTILSESCRRTAFHYWLDGEQQPCVMICGSANVAQAEEILQGRFDDRVVKVERIRRGSY